MEGRQMTTDAVTKAHAPRDVEEEVEEEVKEESGDQALSTDQLESVAGGSCDSSDGTDW